MLCAARVAHFLCKHSDSTLPDSVPTRISQAESLGPDAMLDAALRVLRSIFGEEAVPQPKAWVVSQWAAEPFTRGSYSYVAVGASGEDYDLLSRPWAKVLLGVVNMVNNMGFERG